MSTPPTDREHPSGWYRIRVKGRLDARWATRFDGMALIAQDDGTTLLEWHVVDQAALHGLLRQVSDAGLPLISVQEVGPVRPHTPTATRRQS